MKYTKTKYKVISALVELQYTLGSGRYNISFSSYSNTSIEVYEAWHHSIYSLDKMALVLNKLPIVWYISITDGRPVITICLLPDDDSDRDGADMGTSTNQ